MDLGSVSLTRLVQHAITKQIVRGTEEVRVASDTRLGVEPGEDLIEESNGSSRIRNTADVLVQRELGNPDLGQAVAVRSADGLCDEGLELIGSVAVPVDGQARDAARRAVANELLEPGQAQTRGGGRGNGGRDQLGLAGVGRDVVLVVARGLRGRHVGLRGHVGLVEAQDVAAARGERCLDGGNPAAEVLGTPEHGHILDAGRQAAVHREGPVVGPGDGAAGAQREDKGGVIVGGTTLGSAAALLHLDCQGLGDWDGEGRGGKKASGEQLSEGDHFDMFKRNEVCVFCSQKRRNNNGKLIISRKPVLEKG